MPHIPLMLMVLVILVLFAVTILLKGRMIGSATDLLRKELAFPIAPSICKTNPSIPHSSLCIIDANALNGTLI